MLSIFLVFVGGGIGAALRHGVNVAAAAWFGIDAEGQLRTSG